MFRIEVKQQSRTGVLLPPYCDPQSSSIKGAVLKAYGTEVECGRLQQCIEAWLLDFTQGVNISTQKAHDFRNGKPL